MTIAPPSRNLTLDNTLVGVLSLWRAKLLQNMDDMLPAKVIAYNRTTNRAQIQPLIYQVTTLNELVNRAQIASVPVLQIGGGGFVMSFPINPGDLGWIKANDRDISLFLRNYEIAAPNTQRKHNFSDALFIPDSFMKDVTIASEDANNMVIQNLDGSVRIAIWPDKVKITAPSIILDTPTTTCTGDLIVDGDTTVTGNIIAQSDVTIDGDLIVDGIATINGIDFAMHRHTGVTTGSSNTGTPI